MFIDQNNSCFLFSGTGKLKSGNRKNQFRPYQDKLSLRTRNKTKWAQSDPGQTIRSTVGKLVRKIGNALNASIPYEHKDYGRYPNHFAKRQTNSGKTVNGTHLDVLLEDYPGPENQWVIDDARASGLKRKESILDFEKDLNLQQTKFTKLPKKIGKDAQVPHHIAAAREKVDDLKQYPPEAMEASS